jgi:hypothetical protein
LVGVDDKDITFIPAKVKGALFESVLEAPAFLIGDDLMGRRLADVNHR